jgi:hypothetical protein
VLDVGVDRMSTLDVGITWATAAAIKHGFSSAVKFFFLIFIFVQMTSFSNFMSNESFYADEKVAPDLKSKENPCRQFLQRKTDRMTPLLASIKSRETFPQSVELLFINRIKSRNDLI